MNTQQSQEHQVEKSVRALEIESMIESGQISVPDEVREGFAQMAANFEQMGLSLTDFVAQCWAAKDESDKA